MIEHLYFDENMPQEMEGFLRGMGYTVHTVVEISARSEDDSTQLRISTERGWVLITQNRRDFRRLHWLWTTFHNWDVLPQAHSGVLTIYRQRPELMAEWAAAIHEFLQGREHIRGKMYMWRPSRNEWEEEPDKVHVNYAPTPVAAPRSPLAMLPALAPSVPPPLSRSAGGAGAAGHSRCLTGILSAPTSEDTAEYTRGV